MTRHDVRIDADRLEEAAFKTGVPIERDDAEQRMYLSLDGIRFFADSPTVVGS